MRDGKYKYIFFKEIIIRCTEYEGKHEYIDLYSSGTVNQDK